jgi:hypothetical protein
VISEHVYTVTLIGDPDVELGGARSGRVSFDAGRAPHVQATVTLGLRDGLDVSAFDPRLTPRIRVGVLATFPSEVQDRSFDLGLRESEINHADGTVTLTLASDEALLNDFAPLVDDDSLFALQGSLRDVVNYALNVAIPGASLEPGPDADVTTYGDATNLIPDPSNEGDGSIFIGSDCTLDLNDTSWAAHGATSVNLYSPIDSDAFVYVGGDTGEMRLGMSAGRTYVLSATGRVKVALSGAEDVHARRLTAWYYLPTANSYTPVVSEPIPATVGTPERVSVRFTIPQDATEAFIRAYHGHAAGEIQWDAFRLTEFTGDPGDTDYFDGDTTDTDGYVYEWTGDANASTSRRTALIARDPQSLLWKSGVPAYELLNPIVQAAGLRLVCDENRQWSLRDEEYRAVGSLAIRHAVNLHGGRDTISRDTALWFDARVTRYTWTDREGRTQVRTDEYALNDPYTRLTTLDIAAPYPGPGRSEYAVRRAQGRGREITASSVSDWRSNAEQPMTVVLDGTPILTGIAQTLEYDLDTDRQTVTMRAVDTPALAWVLGPDTLTWDAAEPLPWDGLTDWTDLEA